jgi:hypothetical protein
VIIEWNYPSQGLSDERKQAHRIERLLEEQIKLLQRISAQLPPAEFVAPDGTATMAFVAPAAQPR